MKRFMITAMGSNSGKTVLTCGIMALLLRRGLRVQGFKSGPDYIDPMFHSRVLGVPSRNLDLFLQGEAGVRRTLGAHQNVDVAIIEGAMGYYDGLGGTDAASAWALAQATETPAFLVVRPKGASLTLAAQINGMQQFRSPSRLAGVLLSDCKPMLYAHLKPVLEQETGLPVLGYLPPMEEARLPSRHLGLLTAEEISDLNARFAAIAAQLENTLDVQKMLDLAEENALPVPADRNPSKIEKVLLAVARDEAFCFYYADTLDALQQAGAELAFFSPLRDEALPAGIGGLYLGGGYPELYAQRLSENRSLRAAVAKAVGEGLPTVAECGGFLYLQQTLEDAEGCPWPMAGALPGQGFKTKRLQRFGYLHLTAQQDSLLLRAGEQLPAHEFHYWDCTENGTDLAAQKPTTGRSWHCGVTSETLYAAFPHLHFGGELPVAQRFVQAAQHYAKITNHP